MTTAICPDTTAARSTRLRCGGVPTASQERVLVLVGQEFPKGLEICRIHLGLSYLLIIIVVVNPVVSLVCTAAIVAIKPRVVGKRIRLLEWYPGIS